MTTTVRALASFGVTKETLSVQERGLLLKNGYLLFPKLISSAKCQVLAELIDQEVPDSSNSEPGAERLSDLTRMGPEFDILWQHPKLLAAVNAVLGDDMMLSSLDYRSPLPGSGLQGLHRDKGSGYCNAMWFIDEFTPRNGAIRVVPGSHRFDSEPKEVMSERQQVSAVAGQSRITAKSGSLLVFDAALWHAGGPNMSAGKRRACLSFWRTRRSSDDRLEWVERRRALAARTPPAGRILLGYLESGEES